MNALFSVVNVFAKRTHPFSNRLFCVRPSILGGFGDQGKLGPLIGRAQRITFLGGGKTALGGEAKVS
jgi:hypothetical protein